MKELEIKTLSLRSSSSLRRNAFTMIELLVVVAVILILMGISLKMMSVVSNKTGTAKTLYVLEQTRNALDAYYATIGTYPNTTVVKYDRFNGVGKSSWPIDISTNIPDIRGLTYYLGTEPNARAASWQKFASTVIVPLPAHTNSPVYYGAAAIKSTNSVDSIIDAWNREIVYVPNANCDGYTLYSVGPDGAAGTKDDIGITKNE